MEIDSLAAVWEQVEPLVRDRTGLDPNILGQRFVSQALEQAWRASGLTCLAYTQQLPQSSDLLARLVEQLVVRETWFFREPRAFELLVAQAHEWQAQCQAGADAGPFRILSLPCSTGEEAYSLAIALLEAGFLPEQFSVEGVDISSELLKQGQAGRYSDSAFRGQQTQRTAQLQQQYFTPVQGSDLANAHRVTPLLRQCVSFQSGNLLGDLEMLLEQGPYDVVFCRNLLIYFDVSARQQAYFQLQRLTREGGLIVFGSADVNPLQPLPFMPLTSEWSGDYRGYRNVCEHHNARSRGNQGNSETLKYLLPPSRWVTTPAVPVPVPAPVLTPLFRPASLTTASLTTASPTTASFAKAPPCSAASDASLERAKAAANTGDTALALDLCQTLLVSETTNAEVYCLLGALHQAENELDLALLCFGRALYLDPHSEKALLHAALLYEQQGNEEKARHLRSRLARLEPFRTA